MSERSKEKVSRISPDNETDDVARLASEILAAYLPHADVAPADLPALIREVRRALEIPVQDEGGTRKSEFLDKTGSVVARAFVSRGVHNHPASQRGAQRLQPAVPVAESVHDEYLVSLEDGKRYRSLRRHLMAKYGMTPQQYREKWGLPHSYPMVAPSYARERSEVARRTGLGRSSGKIAKRKRAPAR